MEKLVEKECESLWERRYQHLIDADVEMEQNHRYEIRKFLEKAELPSLISVIRQELEKIVKKELK